MKFSPQKPSKFQMRLHDFYNITFSHQKKAKFTDLFNKRLWNFSSQIYREILLVDLIKQLFDLFKRKGLFWALF